jgi:hypothetical protein
MRHALALVAPIRPYRSIERLGETAWKTQCYYITHLLFVVSHWGTLPLHNTSNDNASDDDGDGDGNGGGAFSCTLFIEELTFLYLNLAVAVAVGDAELVGEFLQCLWILGVGRPMPTPTPTSTPTPTAATKRNTQSKPQARKKSNTKPLSSLSSSLLSSFHDSSDPVIQHGVQFLLYTEAHT